MGISIYIKQTAVNTVRLVNVVLHLQDINCIIVGQMPIDFDLSLVLKSIRQIRQIPSKGLDSKQTETVFLWWIQNELTDTQ